MIYISDINIKQYHPEYKQQWDCFVTESRNGTFLIYRDFMEYHSDRFQDHSLLFYAGNKLIAVLPGNIKDSIFYSHQGLTYGGLVLLERTRTVHVLAIFEHLKRYLSEKKIIKMVYKPIPHIYHSYPTEEDLYALFRNKARLVERGVSSCIDLRLRLKYSEQRKRKIRKNIEKGFVIKETLDFEIFWKILASNLQEKYNVLATHSFSEINLLKSKFPNNIKLFEISKSNVVLGGCITFDSITTRHLQYIAASSEGKEENALDTLIDELIQSSSQDFSFFDFGVSTENGGEYLNQRLIYQKENFGARSIVYDTYQMNI